MRRGFSIGALLPRRAAMNGCRKFSQGNYSWMSVKNILGMNSTESELVEVRGWTRTSRSHKAVSFVSLSDGSSLANVQLVGSADVLPPVANGTSVVARGRLVRSPGKQQAVEIECHSLEVVGSVTEAYPMQKKGHSLSFLREQAHFRSRGNLFGAVLRIRNTVFRSVNEYFWQAGFLHLTAPTITSSQCEGGSVPFSLSPLSFFNQPAYLSVSAQLHAEIFARSHTNVFTLGPTYRADPSDSPRHVAEFWMCEPEMAFRKMEDGMEVAEDLVKHVLTDVLRSHEEELAFLQQWQEPSLLDRIHRALGHEMGGRHENGEGKNGVKRQQDRWHRMTLEESAQLLGLNPATTKDLSIAEEKELCDKVQGPIFLTHFPSESSPFYMKTKDRKHQSCSEGTGNVSLSFDLLMPSIGEVIGGSEREDDPEILLSNMRQTGLNPSEYEWYVALRQQGTVPSVGFGLGMDRLVMFVTGMTSIRDVIPIPRAMGSLHY